MEILWPFLLLSFIGAVWSTDNRTITYKAGDNVTFQCPSNNTLETFEWRKSDMKHDECLFGQREGRMLNCDQDPSLHGRVVWSNQSTDRNASVVLMEATASDAGTYECRVPNGNNESKVLCIYQLKFEGGGNYTGPNDVGTWSAGVIAAIAVPAVGVAVLIFWFCCHGKRRCSTSEPNNPNTGEEGVPLEVSVNQAVEEQNQ